MSYIRKRAIEGLRAGETFSVTRTFTQEDVQQFADITKDYNPVHFDSRFAQVKNFAGRICHGLLVASLVTEIGGQIGWLAAGMNFTFRRPVFCGDTITCDFTITEIDERGRAVAQAIFTNEDRVTVVEGMITGIIPGAQEKEIMKSMVAEGDPTTNKIA